MNSTLIYIGIAFIVFDCGFIVGWIVRSALAWRADRQGRQATD